MRPLRRERKERPSNSGALGGALVPAASRRVGAMSMAYDTTMGALLQLSVLDAMRGRIMGMYVLTFGFPSVGGFVAGAIASVLGAPFAIGLGGGIGV